MPWDYYQSTGKLYRNGQYIATGYSGKGMTKESGRNNPAMESVGFKGPIPAGNWSISTPYSHPTKGPIVMELLPLGHNAHGRDRFLIHGNNNQNDASEGCIILGPDARKKIAESNDHLLTVSP